jgi:hypothetical protein
MRLRRVLLLLASLMLVPSAFAAVFPNAKKGYSFETPDSWRLAHPDYMLASPSGASLSESDLPPLGMHTLDKISKSAGMIACIGADYEDTNEQFKLDGEGWNGMVKVFLEPRRTSGQQRHVLQLVAQHGEIFRIYYLAVPSREWLSDRGAFTKVLAGLRFQ